MKHSRNVPVVSYEASAALVSAATAHAGKKGWRVAAVVVDPFGNIVASGRMDGVSPPIFDYANDKAYTAGTLGKPTSEVFERMSSSPGLSMGVINRNRLCVWDGGVPIIEDGSVIGGLGVSGAAGPEDVQCARTALRECGFSN